MVCPSCDMADNSPMNFYKCTVLAIVDFAFIVDLGGVHPRAPRGDRVLTGGWVGKCGTAQFFLEIGAPPMTYFDPGGVDIVVIWRNIE